MVVIPHYRLLVASASPNPKTAKVTEQSLDRVINGFCSDGMLIPDNYFDVISFNNVLERLPDPWAALKLAKLKLKKGGNMVVSIPNFHPYLQQDGIRTGFNYD